MITVLEFNVWLWIAVVVVGCMGLAAGYVTGRERTIHSRCSHCGGKIHTKIGRLPSGTGFCSEGCVLSTLQDITSIVLNEDFRPDGRSR